MRDLLVVVIFALSLPFALRYPFVGILIYFWISFMNPHRYTWGFANHLPLAMVAAIVALLSAFFNFKELRFPKTRETYLFLLLWVYFTVTTVYSLYPGLAWPEWQILSKVFLMSFLTMLVVTTRERLLYFVLAIIAYIGFISLKGAVFGVLTAAQHRIFGPEMSYLADNNDVGLAMILIIPLCFTLKELLTKKWHSFGLLGIGIASVITCVLTYSRGALVGIVVMGSFYFLKARNKVVVAFAILIIVGLGFKSLPSTWFDRMETIKTYNMDGSANARINAWHFSYRMARMHILGGGFECFTREQYLLHNVWIDSFGFTAHSIYFEILAEHGFGGLAIYLSCLISILLSLRKLNRLSRYLPKAGWISVYSRAFTVSIIGFMACGSFLSRAYFDLFWAIYVAAICFKAIVFSGDWIEMPEYIDESKHINLMKLSSKKRQLIC